MNSLCRVCLPQQTQRQYNLVVVSNTGTHTYLYTNKLVFMSMAGTEQGDISSSIITIPLLNDERVHHVNGSDELLEAKTWDLHTSHEGKTSFFKTCFNLINALSGNLHALSFFLVFLGFICINFIFFCENLNLVRFNFVGSEPLLPYVCDDMHALFLASFFFFLEIWSFWYLPFFKILLLHECLKN